VKYDAQYTRLYVGIAVQVSEDGAMISQPLRRCPNLLPHGLWRVASVAWRNSPDHAQSRVVGLKLRKEPEIAEISGEPFRVDSNIRDFGRSKLFAMRKRSIKHPKRHLSRRLTFRITRRQQTSKKQHVSHIHCHRGPKANYFNQTNSNVDATKDRRTYP
jgi:hypothetical protein